jgi:hypothetical protein
MKIQLKDGRKETVDLKEKNESEKLFVCSEDLLHLPVVHVSDKEETIFTSSSSTESKKRLVERAEDVLKSLFPGAVTAM